MNYLCELLVIKSCLVAENDRACVLYLILVEFAEASHHDLASFCIDNCGEAVDLDVLISEVLNGNYYVRQLADARWLDKNSVRAVFLDYFLERATEIADEGTADATRVHLVNLYSCILEETAVHSDFSEFVLYEDDLFVTVSLSDEFLYQCCFAGSEKA